MGWILIDAHSTVRAKALAHATASPPASHRGFL